jgi:energy-converting hydrogenase Eha subunit F
MKRSIIFLMALVFTMVALFVGVIFTLGIALPFVLKRYYALQRPIPRIIQPQRETMSLHD